MAPRGRSEKRRRLDLIESHNDWNDWNQYLNPIIDLINVTKTYRSKGKSVLALQDVTLPVEQGSFTTIIGPSAPALEYSVEDEQAGWGMLLRQPTAAPLVRYISAYFEVAQDHFVGLGRYKDLHDRLQHLERYYTIIANIMHASGRSSLSRANQLTIAAQDPISKIPEYKVCAVRVARAAAPPDYARELEPQQ